MPKVILLSWPFILVTTTGWILWTYLNYAGPRFPWLEHLAGMAIASIVAELILRMIYRKKSD